MFGPFTLRLVPALVVSALSISAGPAVVSPPPTSSDPTSTIETKTHLHEASGTEVRTGKFRVFEDREARAGRVLELDVVVLPATGRREPDPVFVLLGGPGLAAATHWNGWVGHWMRDRRDIVLVSQRGTGGSNRLGCSTPAGDDNPQGYLDPYFDEAVFRECLDGLSRRADLSKYSTPIAMDDLNDVRIALGYDRINLYGGSYGSRAQLVYIRRHPETVRTAILNSVAPISFTNPLYHARGAQDVLEMIFDECAADPACSARFGDLRAKFNAVLERLDEQPADAIVAHPVSGEPVPVRVSRDAFTESMRFMMYSGIRDVPLII
ncbi:MAG: alpha/beta hydrolase, partial [Phycisphaerales bacterium]|nr:alpha/beta hydrolase [Phycisphaerales bacterium]